MKVAIIGLGHMGMGMAKNLVKAGHHVTAFDLSSEVISISTGQSWSVTINSPVPGIVASAPSSHNFEPGAVPHTLAKDLGLAAKAMETANYHCQLGTQARELYEKMTASKFADQDFSGIINYLADVAAP